MIRIATILLVAYLTITGVGKSFSDSYYTHPAWRWAWFLVLSLVGFGIMSELHPISRTYLFHFAALGVLLVGVAPNFRAGKVHGLIHYLGAITAGVLGYLAIGVEFGAWGYSLVFVILSVGVGLVTRSLYWIEVFVFGGLLIYLNYVCG